MLEEAWQHKARIQALQSTTYRRNSRNRRKAIPLLGLDRGQIYAGSWQDPGRLLGFEMYLK